MILSLKLKLRLALVFIFGLLLLVVSSSHYALFKITDRTKNVFKANYESLEYVEQMRAALDVPDFQQFEQYLKKQERNVTEVGEAEVTVLLREGFTNFLKVRSDTLRRQVRQHLSTIHQLNRQAIIRANDATYALAESYAFWLAPGRIRHRRSSACAGLPAPRWRRSRTARCSCRPTRSPRATDRKSVV